MVRPETNKIFPRGLRMTTDRFVRETNTFKQVAHFYSAKAAQISVWIIGTILASFLSASMASAQTPSDRLSAYATSMDTARSFFKNLPDQTKKALSAGGASFFHLASNWPQLQQSLAQTQTGLSAPGVTVTTTTN